MTHSRIVEAMHELKDRRDDGELVHEIISEIAENHDVSPTELQERAEASWGAPLETDRERNASHFSAVESAADMARQARDYAKLIYELNLPYVRAEKWWDVNWTKEIDEALLKIEIDPALQKIARDEFLDAASHYASILERVRKK